MSPGPSSRANAPKPAGEVAVTELPVAQAAVGSAASPAGRWRVTRQVALRMRHPAPSSKSFFSDGPAPLKVNLGTRREIDFFQAPKKVEGPFRFQGHPAARKILKLPGGRSLEVPGRPLESRLRAASSF